MRGVKRLRSDAGLSDAFSAIPEAMQNSLAQQFEALGPDVGLRLANLRTLLSSLTPQETRFMRLHLQSLPAPADIVSRFPTDILVEISPYLCALDIVNILNVSKAWRKSWSQRDVVRALAKHHMPNFLQFYHHRNRSQSPDDSTDQDLFNAFHQAARKFSIRQQGLFQSTISNPAPWLHFLTRDRFFTLEPTDDVKDWGDVYPGWGFDEEIPDNTHHLFNHGKTKPGAWKEYAYCDGKVAWMPETTDINLASVTFVDDLRSQKRRVYKVPIPVVLHGSTIHLVALGSELVVVSARRTCYAWDLETGEPDSVTLPSLDIHRVKVEKKRMYILTEHAKVYVWTFKHGIREIDISAVGKPNLFVTLADEMEPLPRCLGRTGIFDILPHPLLDDTFYLFYFKDKAYKTDHDTDEEDEDEDDKVIVVYELNHNGTLRLHTATLPHVWSLTREWGTGDFDFDFLAHRDPTDSDSDDDYEDNIEDYFSHCTQKVDPYGNYAIGQCFLRGRLLKRVGPFQPGFRGIYDDDEKYDEESGLRPNQHLGYTVFFNALTASISTSPFISGIDQDPPIHSGWGGQQIEVIRAPTLRNDLCFCMLLVSESNGQKHLESMDDLPIYCPSSFNSLKEFLPVNHRFTERLANTPAKPGKMTSGYKCSNIVSRYLTERRELVPSIQPQYGLDITFDDEGLHGETRDDFKALWLEMDEDFLVCFGQKGYVAWSFYHDMKDKNATD
ncbi:hypothetical protein QBC32DRAFT_53834 [Pseudoneurospora amorphoporcata]|uniref:F-box domain-containing protein n=1 Tax=Pseudoneurospora amorphoporcata TaxID=241081 RepID=A0AAN6NMI2_9PEZI|nr:hypothetical protein QBC32DRAFT_53834 [Pseudoneurospora amorphoporcata]